MVDKHPTTTADIRGLGRSTIDAIAGVVDLVEAMHYTIANDPSGGRCGLRREHAIRD